MKTVRCAIYIRKSTEEGLHQEFNSLDAQREASEAFLASQKNEGWQVITNQFDDAGYTGGNMDRPALKRFLAAVEARSMDCIVVYKVDRLSRSLLDFARIIEVFDRHRVSFVAVDTKLATIEGAWNIGFQPKRGAPPQRRYQRWLPGNENSDGGVKFFSGTATYSKTVDASADWFKAGGKLRVDLGV